MESSVQLPVELKVLRKVKGTRVRFEHRIRDLYRATLEDDYWFAFRIAGAYLALGLIWITASDRVLMALVREHELLTRLQTLKGWLFVIVTSVLLYFLTWATVRARRKQQVSRLESERFLATLTENLPGTVYACAYDADWSMIYLSPEVETLTGYLPEELRDNNRLSFGSLIHEDDRERIWTTVQESVAARQPFQVEYRLHTRSGDMRWVWEQGRGVFDAKGELLRLEGYLMDVTQRHRAKDLLKRQLAQLQALRAIDLAIMGSFDLKITLDVVLDHVTDQLGVDAASVLVFDPRSERLEHASGRGFRTAALRHTKLRLGEGHAGEAAMTRRPVHVADLRNTPGDLNWSWLVPEEGFVTYFAVPLITRGELKGVLELFHRATLEPVDAWLEFRDILAGQAAIAVDNGTLIASLEQTNLELRAAYDQTIEGLARALELRDDETEGHSRRVATLTVALAERMNVDPAELTHIWRGALLHDLGKLGVPDSILLKPGPLTDEERHVMSQHPVHAQDLLSSIPFLKPALAIPRSHHEKWDGSGYPSGLQGEEIPLAARIFAVVDVWDALRSDRPYRKAWPEETARDHIRREAGSHFDPEVVEVFLGMDPTELGRLEGRSAVNQGSVDRGRSSAAAPS